MHPLLVIGVVTVFTALTLTALFGLMFLIIMFGADNE
jgi:hypothetical protein